MEIAHSTRNLEAEASGGRVVHMTAPLGLEFGGTLEPWRLAFRSYGRSDSPTVLVLGGISADRHIARGPDEPGRGWWQDFVGPGLAVDTDRFHVLGIDYVGGPGGSTSPVDWPAERGPFPAITPKDQARAIVALLDRLGIPAAHAIIGASYGGMVALAFASLFADRSAHALVLSAAHESHPMATALRSLQRRVVRLGLAAGVADEALRVARGIAMTTYRSAEEFLRRFDNVPAWTPDGVRFPVEDYLEHHGRKFGGAFQPACFLCLSESLDLHRVEPATIRAPTTLVAVDTDTLVPPWQMRSLHAQLAAPSRLIELTSIYGHDAFLKETEAVSEIVRDVLGSVEMK